MNQWEIKESLDRLLASPSNARAHIAFQIIGIMGCIITLCLTGCVSAQYTTHRNSDLANACGSFRAQSSTRGVAVSEAAQNYGATCRDIQMAGADAAYVQSLTATATWYATQGTAQQEDVEAVAAGLTDHLVGHDDGGAE